MPADPNRIANLSAMVVAAREEFDAATSYHEAWKPMAYDSDLHTRMGASYASNTFITIRSALRREMLLALTRLWDTHRSSVSMARIITALDDKAVVAHFEEERRKERRGIPTCHPDHYSADDIAEFEQSFAALNKAAEDEQANALRDDAAAAVVTLRTYQKGGAKADILIHLQHLRNKQLAHRDMGDSDSGVPTASTNDAAIEDFYQDMSKVIHLLISVVRNTDYRPEHTATLRRDHAVLFWAGVRGERTEGHPNYRAPWRP